MVLADLLFLTLTHTSLLVATLHSSKLKAKYPGLVLYFLKLPILLRDHVATLLHTLGTLFANLIFWSYPLILT